MLGCFSVRMTKTESTLRLPSQTFHTPSLGDEEFEIPPISLDPDSALTVSDVVSQFGELSDTGPSDGVVVPRNAVVEGDDPSFASTFVGAPSRGLEHLSLGVMNQSGRSSLLEPSLGMVRCTRRLNIGCQSLIRPFSFLFLFSRILVIPSTLSSATHRR